MAFDKQEHMPTIEGSDKPDRTHIVWTFESTNDSGSSRFAVWDLADTKVTLYAPEGRWLERTEANPWRTLGLESFRNIAQQWGTVIHEAHKDGDVYS